MGLPRVVVIGGGFGGLKTTRSLKNAQVKITLVDRTNHHLFQPLLYQVASSALGPGDIAYPIREILKNQKNVTVIMDEATKILPKEQAVMFASGRYLKYDYLVVAVGTKHSYFEHPEWENDAPGLKNLGDAIKIRSKILYAFEQAEATDSRKQAEQFLTFVVVGGGPTGVELAGAIGEIAHKTLLKNFRHIDPSQSKIYLVESGAYILPTYPKDLSMQAEKDLSKLGVTILKNSHIRHIENDGVWIGDRKISSTNIIWAAGNQAPELLSSLDVPQDYQRRIMILPDLSVPGYPEIFVIGDAAHLKDKQGKLLPGIAPVAIQQGNYIGNLIARDLRGSQRIPFKYKDMGVMATIGKARAVAWVAGSEYTGFTAWMIWSLVHIVFLIGFRNRLIVMLEWLFWYITEKRSSRLLYKAVQPKTYGRLNPE